MNKFKRCIIYLYQFPFKTSEPFMETEINYLSKVFDEIVIFSVNMNKNEPETRTYPLNVRAFPLNCPHKKTSNIFKGCFTFVKGYKKLSSSIKKTAANLYTIGRMKTVYKRSLETLKKIRFNFNDCVIYSYWLNLPLPALLLKRYCLKNGFKNVSAISRAHGYDVYSERNSINYIPYQQKYISELDYVFPCSEDGKNYLINKYKDINNLENKIITKRLGTKDHGICSQESEGEIVFATCSRFRKLKRIPLFAKAFALLLKEGIKAHWYIIGDGEEYDSLMSLFEELGIKEHIVLLGRLQNTKVYEFYKNTHIDYFVNTSSVEGVPVSIMEAMSFGIPCIATNVGGTSEILNNNCGLLINPDVTPEELSKLIKEEIEHNYNKKRALSRQQWETLCSAKTNYTDWAKTISNLD